MSAISHLNSEELLRYFDSTVHPLCTSELEHELADRLQSALEELDDLRNLEDALAKQVEKTDTLNNTLGRVKSLLEQAAAELEE